MEEKIKSKEAMQMDYLQKILKKSGWISILISAIFAILGIILIWKPEETIKAISYVLGGIFIVIGLVRIIAYITAKGKSDFYNLDIVFGILAIILGIVTIIYSNMIATFLNLIVGVWIVYSALVRLNVSIKLKNKVNNRAWLYTLILAIIMLICGLYVIFNSTAIIAAIGIAFFIYSIIDIIEQIIFMVNIKDIF